MRRVRACVCGRSQCRKPIRSTYFIAVINAISLISIGPDHANFPIIGLKSIRDLLGAYVCVCAHSGAGVTRLSPMCRCACASNSGHHRGRDVRVCVHARA